MESYQEWCLKSGGTFCNNTSLFLSEGTRSNQDWDQFAGRFAGGSGASPSSWKLFVSLLTVVKSLRCRVMRLAGYICPTTEEVACESRDPAPPKKNRHSSLPLSNSDFKRDQREVQAVEGDGSFQQGPLSFQSVLTDIMLCRWTLVDRPSMLFIGWVWASFFFFFLTNFVNQWIDVWSSLWRW